MPRKIIHFDWALKKLLRQKANYDILEGFLSVLLNQDIIIDNIVDSESNKEHDTDKYNRVDVFAQTSAGELIIIEVQVDSEVDYFQRMAYGTRKAITQYIEEGAKYIKVKKVYLVNIVYFDLGQGNDYVYHGTTEFIGLHNNDVLQLSEKQKNAMPHTTVANIFPEYYVLRVNNFNDVAKDSLDEWVYVLKNSAVEDSFKAKGLSKVKEALLYENMTDAEKQNYQAFMGHLRKDKSTIFTAKLEGLIEGEQIGKLKTSLKALRKGFALSDVAELTDLPVATVEQLQLLLNKYGADAEQYMKEILAD